MGTSRTWNPTTKYVNYLEQFSRTFHDPRTSVLNTRELQLFVIKGNQNDCRAKINAMKSMVKLMLYSPRKTYFAPVLYTFLLVKCI